MIASAITSGTVIKNFKNAMKIEDEIKPFFTKRDEKLDSFDEKIKETRRRNKETKR